MADILIVDDNYVMREKIKEIMIELGHEIAGEAEDGKKAILKYRELKPDLVTLDIVMPEMNGIDTLEELKRKFPSSKVIMVSSINQRKDVLKAVELGADHYIVKPIKIEGVAEVVSKVLGIENKYNSSYGDTDNSKDETDKSKEKNNGSKQENEEGKNKNLDSDKADGKEGLLTEERTLDTSDREAVEVINKDGILIIRVNREIDDELIDDINNLIKGFLMIKPLKVSFDLMDSNFSSKTVEARFDKIQQKIKAVGGKVNTQY